jgi:hypothetical protein
LPPWGDLDLIRVAPASSAFSTSSLTARGRAFDHLTGRDPVDRGIVELADHGTCRA